MVDEMLTIAMTSKVIPVRNNESADIKILVLILSQKYIANSFIIITKIDGLDSITRFLYFFLTKHENTVTQNWESTLQCSKHANVKNETTEK